MLEEYVNQNLQKRDILLMTHIVLGYPDFPSSLRIAEIMVREGVELMELQIPFSEPIADGPVILGANQQSLARGSTVERCFDAAATLAARHPIPFLFMSYYNVLHRKGASTFVGRMKQAGLRGAIVPDLPPEEGTEYLDAMTREGLDPIFLFSPNTSDARLQMISRLARGFVYCVARKGVTGGETQFSTELDGYLSRCRRATKLPLALGFGVRSKEDVDFLRGKVEIAVVGSETLRVIDRDGVDAVGPFIRSLRGR